MAPLLKAGGLGAIQSDAIAHIEENRLSADQKIAQTNDPHWMLVKATVNDPEQPGCLLLGYAFRLEVISPRRLRSFIGGSLERATHLYF